MDVDEWMAFFLRVKRRPDEFYRRCKDLLIQQDIYEPDDLADLDFKMLKGPVERSSASVGQIVFLEQAVSLAKADKVRKFRGLDVNPLSSEVAAPIRPFARALSALCDVQALAPAPCVETAAMVVKKKRRCKRAGGKRCASGQGGCKGGGMGRGQWLYVTNLGSFLGGSGSGKVGSLFTPEYLTPLFPLVIYKKYFRFKSRWATATVPL